MRQLVFIAFISLLVVNDVTTELNNDTNSHITGSLRIKRSCIPEPILNCMFKNDASSIEHCPHAVDNWSDVHCVNNSFGLYTPQSQFMALGAGPLGINMNDGYIQYVSYIPRTRQHPKENAEAKKIEHLIEEKAKMETKASFFETRFHEMEMANEELHNRLQKSEEKSNAYALQINSLTIRLNRWEQGSAACKQDLEGQQEKTSAALQICNNHIAQLEKENTVYMDTNRELSDTVSKLQHSCDSIRTSNTQCNVHLSECSAQLGICEKSQHELEVVLGEQAESHKKYVHRTEKEYSDIHSLMQSAREDLSECTASLDAARDRSAGLQRSRDSCISRMSKENTLLKQCKEDLHRCHGNHTMSSDMHDECRAEINQFTNRFNSLQEHYMKCTSDLTETTLELQSQRKKNSELIAAENSRTSQLELLKHKNENGEKRISELTNLYSAEKVHYQEARSDLHSCQTDLRTVTEMEHTHRSEINELKEMNIELTISKTECLKARQNLARDVSVTLSKLNNAEENLRVCERQLGKYQTENDRLISTASTLQGELSSLKKIHAVLVSQNADCMAKHNVSLQTSDDWKDQYMQCNSENRNLTALLLACNTKKEFLTNMLRSLEQEAEVSLRTQENLASRLEKSTTIISDLTKTVAEGDRRLNELQEEIGRTITAMEEKQAAYLAKSQQYVECHANYSISLQTITELQRNAQFNSELLDALKKQTKETSDQLVDVQAALSHNQALLDQETNNALGLRTRLDAAQELHENERQMRQAVEFQLQHCRGNHTEAVTETRTLAVRVEKCGHRVNELIENHEHEMQQVEARLSAVNIAKETAAEAHGQINASLHYCQKQQAQLESEKENLQHQVGECAQSLHLHITKVEYVMNLKISLERRLDSCTSESKKCRTSLQIQNYKLEQCNERLLGTNADLDLIRSQLNHCNEQCQKSSLVCPESPVGEAYVVTGSGCLMQTAVSGSEADLERHCEGIQGHLLKLPANDQHFNKDIIDMLHYSGKQATAVWISRPDQPEGTCFSVNISRVESDTTMPVEYLEVPCDKSLPGICFASLHGTGIGMDSSIIGIDSIISGLGGMDSIDSSITSINTIQHVGNDYDVQYVSSGSSGFADVDSSFSSILNGFSLD